MSGAIAIALRRCSINTLSTFFSSAGVAVVARDLDRSILSPGINVPQKKAFDPPRTVMLARL